MQNYLVIYKEYDFNEHCDKEKNFYDLRTALDFVKNYDTYYIIAEDDNDNKKLLTYKNIKHPYDIRELASILCISTFNAINLLLDNNVKVINFKDKTKIKTRNKNAINYKSCKQNTEKYRNENNQRIIDTWGLKD